MSAAKNTSKIHETAIISPGARIGKDVQIGAFTYIGPNVEIGDRTVIASPQDLKFKGEKSFTYIGDRTVIREGATVHRATGEGEETRIGNDCLLMATVHIAHNCLVGNHVIMSNAAMLAGHVVVEDNAVIGGMTGVHQFVKIGRNAMVGGMSRLVQDVVPYTIVNGQPAQVYGLNNVGITRAGIRGGRAFPAVPAGRRARYLPQPQGNGQGIIVHGKNRIIGRHGPSAHRICPRGESCRL